MADSPNTSNSGRIESLPSYTSFRQDVRKLLNNPLLSNVQFRCKDGVVLYADKAFLAVRCDYFERMLYSGLKEATQDKIELPILSSHLLVILEYLHTGGLVLPDPHQAELAMGVYELARQYNILELQDDFLEILPSLLTDANIGEFLTMSLQLHAAAVENQALLYFSAMKAHKGMFANFSQDALTRALVGSSIVNHLDARSAVCFLDAIIEWGRERVEETFPAGDSAGRGAGGQQEAGAAPKQELGEVLSPVFKVISFESLPILDCLDQKDDVLGLLPLERQLEVYRAKAKRAAKRAKLDLAQECPWDPCHHGPGLAVGTSWSNPSRNPGWDVLACTSEDHVSARGTHCFETGVHEWDVMVETSCNHMWVGVAGEGADMNAWLGFQKEGWVIGGNGDRCHKAVPHVAKEPLGGSSISYRGVRYRSLPFSPTCWGEREGTLVCMRVDMGRRECSFKIDGVDCGVAFAGLPCPVYPAVSLISPGHVRFVSYRHTQQS